MDLGNISQGMLAGPVARDNFDQRSAWYGLKIKKWKDSWPLLSNNPDVRATADRLAWDNYFRWLGETPVYRMFCSGRIQFMNVPEFKPEVFDLGYQPLRLVHSNDQ